MDLKKSRAMIIIPRKGRSASNIDVNGVKILIVVTLIASLIVSSIVSLRLYKNSKNTIKYRDEEYNDMENTIKIQKNTLEQLQESYNELKREFEEVQELINAIEELNKAN